MWETETQAMWGHTCSLVWDSPQPCVSDWSSQRTSPPRAGLWWWRELHTLKEGRIWTAPVSHLRRIPTEIRNAMSFRVEAVWFQFHRSSTCGFVVRFLPRKNDERVAALHGNHGDVGRRDTRRTGYIQIVGFFIGEVTEGGGDGARLLWPLICLVDDMRSCGRPCQKSLSYPVISSTLFNLL